MKITRLAILSLAVALTIAGCGGGTGGTGMTGSSAAVSIGVMEKGSVIVNGVRFEDSTANITIDDTPKTAADLRNGMVVKVRGRINADRVSGTAERVEVENEVRGTVQTTSPATVPPSFTVIGQTVLVDDLTVFANFSTASPTPSAAVNELNPTVSVVEVHGQRDAAGNIRASRVELLTAPGANIDELRGTISGLSGTTFTLNGVTVNASGAALTPAGATLNNGDLVEVHGGFSGGIFVATRVDREDLEDAALDPAENEEFEVEGFVAGCGAISCGNTFTVDGRTVQISSSTDFKDGSKADLLDGVKVEAEGRLVGGVLEATKVSFRRTQIRLFGSVEAIDTGARTITLLGKTVQLNDLTSGTPIGTIVITNRVEVRGFVDRSGTIIAQRAEVSSSGTDDFVQAPVEQENETAQTLVLLGTITANLTGTPDNMFFGDDDAALAGGKAAFFSAVIPAATTPPGTLVKVKGTYSPGTLTVLEAEIEN
jgi:hypothetical protein